MKRNILMMIFTKTWWNNKKNVKVSISRNFKCWNVEQIVCKKKIVRKSFGLRRKALSEGHAIISIYVFFLCAINH